MHKEYTYAEGIWREISTEKIQGVDKGRGQGASACVLKSKDILQRRERVGLRENITQF